MIGLMNSTEYYLFVFFVSVFFVFGQTETKFGLMEVASPSGKKNICVNVQQYKGADVLPEGAAAKSFRLVWWDFHFGQSVICRAPIAPNRFGPNDLVPLNYWTRPELLSTACSMFQTNQSPIQHQLNVARAAGVQSFLFLVDKGATNVDGEHDYLHAEFCNSDTVRNVQNNESVFYVYREAFDQFVLPKVRESDAVEFRVYKPKRRFDPAIILLWLLVLLPVAFGSIWSVKLAKDRFVRRSTVRREGAGDESGAQTVEMEQPKSTEDDGTSAEEQQQKESAESEEEKSNCCDLQTMFWLLVIVLFCVFIITLHKLAILVPLFYTLLGTYCLSKCLFALFKYFIFPNQQGEQRVLLSFGKFRLSLLGVLCYGISAVICVCWLLFRKHPLAFVLLDLINVAMVAHWLRYVVFERLKFNKNDLTLRMQFIALIISALLGVVIIVWFILFPPKQPCSPTAPIDSSVFYFFMPMLNDPLDICWDVEVQLGYHSHSVFLPVLVISAGYLPYWFYIDFINDHKMLPYGLIAFSAYALFVLPLFVLGMPHALFDTFDFDLILALPMPAVAGTIFSLVSGTFSKLWKGELKF
ncbi:hypothetical protein GPALN_004536 [Globodera pallida]|nr:hypothetical protein GPALN_004536 [Globodera pallida]